MQHFHSNCYEANCTVMVQTISFKWNSLSLVKREKSIGAKSYFYRAEFNPQMLALNKYYSIGFYYTDLHVF